MQDIMMTCQGKDMVSLKAELEKPRTPTYLATATRRNFEDCFKGSVIRQFGSSLFSRRRSSPVIGLSSRGPTSCNSVRRADSGRREELARKMISKKNKLTNMDVRLTEYKENFLSEIICLFIVSLLTIY